MLGAPKPGFAVATFAARDSTSSSGPKPPESADNVVRPSFARDRAGSLSSARPELAGALDAVIQAADLIRAAQDRADQAEEEARRLADRHEEQTRQAAEDARCFAQRIVEAEQAARRLAERSVEALAGAERQIHALREQARAGHQRAERADRAAADEAGALKRRLMEADERVLAAETRTLVAKQDLAELEAYIRDCFELRSETGTAAR